MLFVAFGTRPPLLGVLLMAALLLLLFGLSAAAGYQIIARRPRLTTGFGGPSPVLVFAAQLVLVNLISALLVAFGVPLEGSGLAFVISAAVLLLGYVALVFLFGVRSGALNVSGLGVPVGAGFGRIAYDIVYGAVAMFLVAILVALWGSLIALLLQTTTPDIVPKPAGSVDALLVVIAACVLIPIGEELFFRGYSLTAWLRDLGPRSALIRSTIFFALVHIINIAVDPSSQGFVDGLKMAVLEVLLIGPVGFALGWIFLRRGLVASIAGHAAFNLFGVLGLLFAPGVLR